MRTFCLACFAGSEAGPRSARRVSARDSAQQQNASPAGRAPTKAFRSRQGFCRQAACGSRLPPDADQPWTLRPTEARAETEPYARTEG